MTIIDLIRYVNGKAISIRCALQIIRKPHEKDTEDNPG